MGRHVEEAAGMRPPALAIVPLAVLACAAHAAAQDVYQQQPKKAFRFAGDTLARYEWTRDIPAEDGFVNEDRYFLQVRPRVELNMGPIELGVGGAFNYSDEENDVPPAGQETLTLVRDNYRSKDARLDLAWGKVKLGPLVARGGRFLMPIPFTEMIWDRTSGRRAGGAASPESSTSRFALHGIYAHREHVFEDESVMWRSRNSASRPARARPQLVGPYLQFEDLKAGVPVRRQNTAGWPAS
jgi:hypothetical protein